MGVHMNRPELMNELNELLGTSFNWGRLSKLDLERIVISLGKRL